MELNYTIERMTAEDLDQVVGIESRSFEHPWVRDIFEAELRHCWSHCDVLRRESDRSVLGYIVFWCVADEVHLLNVCVDPDARHQALGRRLLDHMSEYAKRSGARFITLEVRTSNSTAIQLYETGGFKRVGVRPRYYANNGEDAIIMMLDLGSTTGQLPALN
jgi:ribosomal-protein-alanine N-acetyltransferase